MADLLEKVLHHIEGTETEIQNWQTLDGIKTVEFQSFGPDRWIESVHENGRLMAIDCLALILFTVRKSYVLEQERRIVEGWAAELRKAVSAGEIQARDPVTLLALETLPDGWEWLLSMADADKFIAARGMEWRFCEVALHLFNEFEQAIENRRFPPWTRTTPATDTAPAQTPAPEQSAKPDITLMATRKQLIDAFGAFTGMDIQWFNTIKDTPALLAARKVTGQGGRGHIAEPLFCPFEVLQWLIDTARRKGRPLGPAKGWELFEGHFPRAYAAFSVGDPRTD